VPTFSVFKSTRTFKLAPAAIEPGTESRKKKTPLMQQDDGQKQRENVLLDGVNLSDESSSRINANDPSLLP
jgi:hypothetical protein